MTPAGQRAVLAGARIAGVAACVPAQVIDNTGFVKKFGQKAVDDVTKMIGVNARRWAGPGVTTSDLCQQAGAQLLQRLEWQAGSVDALIFVSQTPDYRLPATASALGTRLGLRSGIIALDINLGCSAYPYALWLGMTMVQSGAARRVLLAVGDTVSRIVDPADRATAMLFGDAGTMTAIEAQAEGAGNKSFFVLGSDGAGERHLIVPQGGFRQTQVQADPRLADRDPACLFMDGAEIFNFTLRTVPALVVALEEASGEARTGWDLVALHQANSFMLKHLAKKCGLAPQQAPSNIDSFGNTSCASIPLLLCTSQPAGRAQTLRLAALGFGVGFSWGGALVDLAPDVPLAFVEYTP
ncbi:ketoacyl-ACP synthase III [uncultured Ramlibacter sp.]|uniref:ketoacyl-ACP synthase III n=1 Tax=uncultured Ramlibacter sp. TaxID=260755 RepID=UPI002639A398|nr:ketoacyl-ACP synthase III [uncultured Ramlibacter sp.]